MEIKPKKINLSKKFICGLLMMIVGFSTIFFSGSLNKNTDYEKIAHYASKVVNENTLKKKYCSLTVESTKDSGAILNHHSEFYNLYGVFRQTKITFGSMVNIYHDYNIHFDEIDSDNLSIFYLGPNGSEEYHGHYKHYIYPFEFMFSGISDVKGDGIFISKTHAHKLLTFRNDYVIEGDDYSNKAYESLLGSSIPINIDGASTSFVIQNIFYEANYYYEGINEIAGEFVLCSYSLPNGILSNLKNLYFLSEYDYQNAYFMKYINEGYENHKYIVRVNHNNIIGNIDDAYLISFYQNYDFNNLLSYFLLAFSFLLLLGSLAFFWFEKEHTFLNHIFVFLLSTIPYTIFYLIFKLSNDITFFSGFSTKVNMFTLLVFYILYFSLILRFKSKIGLFKNEKKSYEIEI